MNRLVDPVARGLLPLVISWMLAFPAPVSALEGFLDLWRAEYPDSTADAAACQLCHANAFGGPPWNTYGIEVVKAYYAEGRDEGVFRAALRLVEEFDSDGDCSTSLEEINAGAQPGWRHGAANRFYDRDNVGGELEVTLRNAMNEPAPEVASLPLESEAECACYLIRGQGRRMIEICL